MDALPRKELKQLKRQIAQSARTQEGPQDLAESWLGSVESMLVRAAMLITDEIGPLIRLLGLQHGCKPAVLELGGILSTVPDLESVVSHFLSDNYDELRGTLTSQQ